VSFFKLQDLQRPRYNFANGLRLLRPTTGDPVQRASVDLSAAGAMTEWTLLIWFYATEAPVSLPMYRNQIASNNHYTLYITISSGLALVQFVSPTVIVSSTSVAVLLNRRNLLVIQRRAPSAGGTGRYLMSLNGNPLVTHTVEPSNTAGGTWGTLHIGSDTGTSFYHKDTIIGEYDMVQGRLTNQDLVAIWNGGRGSSYRNVQLAALPSIVRYIFDETSGTIAYDSSGQTPATPRNATLTGSPTFVAFN
jgi:hypothetical protein